MPFLNTLVMPQTHGTLAATIYRKPTYTDQYIQWDSHCTVSAKHNIISILQRCMFKPWAITSRANIFTSGASKMQIVHVGLEYDKMQKQPPAKSLEK